LIVKNTDSANSDLKKQKLRQKQKVMKIWIMAKSNNVLLIRFTTAIQ